MTNQVSTNYVAHTNPTQGWDSNDGYDDMDYNDEYGMILDDEELNDMLTVAAIKYQSVLESCGYIKSAIYFEPLLNELRDGDNKVILQMIKSYSGFAPFIAKKYPQLIDIITDNIGPIKSDI